MANSKLRMFSSSDPGAPQLQGQSGSLVNLLDAVLVTGYLNKPGLGWTKPLANDSLTSSLACWQQPSGSRMILYVNDAAPTGSTIGGAREAWACGYETIVGLTGSTYPTTGTGYGVFPHYTNIYVSVGNGTVPSSSVWWRKSANINFENRPWLLFGDAHTFYLFVNTGDAVGVYYTYWFGDLYSLRNAPPDNYKCIIRGRMGNQNNGSSYRFDASDILVRPTSLEWPHLFAARPIGGGGFSCKLNMVGDQGKNTPQSLTTPPGSSEPASEISGIIPYPNTVDGSIFMSPIFVTEQSGFLRGRLRGLYHLCHPGVNFTDGQEFEGTGDFAGKRFRCIKSGPAQFINSTVWVMEISDTVETNF